VVTSGPQMHGARRDKEAADFSAAYFIRS